MNLKNVIGWIYKAIFRWDKYFRYSIFTRMVNFIYPRMVHTEYGKYFLNYTDFLAYFRKFEWNNYNSYDRKFTVLQLLKLIKNLNWDTVECWVFRWATSYLILKNINSKKTHHIFDSFEGLSEPWDIDWSYWTKNNLTCWLEIVKDNLKEFKNAEYYKWWIPERFNEVKDLAFSFIHIDVDLYEPTKDSIEFFYERLEKWWVLVCDDYGFSTCPGAKLAMDEYAQKYSLEVLELTTWQWVFIKN